VDGRSICDTATSARGRSWTCSGRSARSDPGASWTWAAGRANLTALLARRWPAAEVVGVDNSPEMIEAARALALPGVSFQLGDVRDWRPEGAPDVITCNAVLQWVPDHHDLVAGWASLLAPGGWLAFQLPGQLSNRRTTRSSRSSPARRAGERCSRTCDLTGRPAIRPMYAELLLRPGAPRQRLGNHVCAYSHRRQSRA